MGLCAFLPILNAARSLILETVMIYSSRQSRHVKNLATTRKRTPKQYVASMTYVKVGGIENSDVTEQCHVNYKKKNGVTAWMRASV